MTCLVCGTWAPSDRETGYDHDVICPACESNGWQFDSRTGLVEQDRDVAAEYEARRADVAPVDDDEEEESECPF